MQLDFSGVQGFEQIPAGVYPASLFSCKQKTSSTNKPMLEWCFTIEEGDFEGRRIFTNVVIQENTMWRLKALLAGFDHGGQDLDGAFEFDPEDLIGQSVYIRVTQRNRPDGTPGNDVSGTIPADQVNE